MPFSIHRRHQKIWEEFAREDPLRAILTETDAKGAPWDLDLFFKTGESTVFPLLDGILAEYGLERRQRALDFGCGVGRLTRCLLPYFKEVSGIDVSSEMIRKARSLNPDANSIEFHDQSDPDLKGLDDGMFDFVLSLITIQHIPEKLVYRYIESLIRLTAEGGLIFLQIPARERHHVNKPLDHGNPDPLTRLYRLCSRVLKSRWKRWKSQSARFRRDGRPYFLMTCVAPGRLFKLFETRGCRVLRVRADHSCGENFESYDYLVRKV